MKDSSRINDAARYRCSSCGHEAFGAQLIPIQAARLTEVDGQIVKTGEIYISNRVCSRCRGPVNPVTPQNAPMSRAREIHALSLVSMLALSHANPRELRRATDLTRAQIIERINTLLPLLDEGPRSEIQSLFERADQSGTAEVARTRAMTLTILDRERTKCSGYTRPEGVLGGPCTECGRSQPEHNQ